VITAEDPVEYYLPGINQVEVRHSIGLDFSRIIRSMLRQAPNIILVGEMRDHETASMGIQASLTGHLVFSTLHTNDAPSSVSRMVDIGVPGYMVASSVIAILAQRLVRTICPRCKVRYQPSEAVLEESMLPPEMIAQAEFTKGKGCPYCGRTGYRGRIGIYELMVINGKLREMMFKGANTNELRVEAIKSGMSTLYADGMLKVIRGITTFEEVYRVAKQTEQEALALNHLVEDLDSL
jgi:type IV pilus assembly protein PilB